ncbi:MAG: hypothetical protein KKF12_09305 [Proteobacteria bacterium]|nr:hypothetical protein [Pseudomonadota bacterium]MBU4131002.1 hypothetical protein [Pseudomonadota bacterium]
MKFVIIGGDAAGISAASRAKRMNPQMDVMVLEQTHIPHPSGKSKLIICRKA